MSGCTACCAVRRGCWTPTAARNWPPGEGAKTPYETSSSTRRVYLPLEDVNPDELIQLPLVVGAVEASAIFPDAAEATAVEAADVDQDAELDADVLAAAAEPGGVAGESVAEEAS